MARGTVTELKRVEKDGASRDPILETKNGRGDYISLLGLKGR